MDQGRNSAPEVPSPASARGPAFVTKRRSLRRLQMLGHGVTEGRGTLRDREQVRWAKDH